MRNIGICTVLGLTLCAFTPSSVAQTRKSDVAVKSDSREQSDSTLSKPQVKKPEIATRRAGLWEITTTLTWQQSPFMPGAVKGIGEGGKHVKDVCLTQEMIDRDGALLPQSHGHCHIENKVMRLAGSTANWVCSGSIQGTGSLETNWTDLEHATGKLHFTGTFQGESQMYPIEWTTESSSVFKSADCGVVEPKTIGQAGPR